MNYLLNKWKKKNQTRSIHIVREDEAIHLEVPQKLSSLQKLQMSLSVRPGQ